MTVTPEMLIAYVDGEADAATIAAVEAQVTTDPDLAAQIARHRVARNRVAAAFAGAIAEPVPDHLIQAVMAGQGDKVVDLSAARAARGTRFLVMAAGMAAALMVGVGIGGQLFGGPIGNDFMIRGQLAQALDRRLASEPVSGDQTRIGISFRTAEGGFCRMFQTPGGDGLAGVACHEGKGWRAVAVAPQPSTGAEYRTASAAPPLVLRTAEALMTGEPLDAAAEARAREAGWR